mgnify:CR=1 FL=1
MNNPFEIIRSEITELKDLVNQLLNKPKEDLTNKLYTLNEAAILLRVDRQSIRNYINKGHIKAIFIGRRILIPHNELYDSLNEVKSLKYKR